MFLLQIMLKIISIITFYDSYIIRRSFICHLHVARVCSYIICMYSYVIRMYSCVICVTRMYLYVIRMSLKFTCMSYICRSSFIRMSFICTHMPPVCHSYAFACHSFVTHMYSYVILSLLIQSEWGKILTLFTQW